MTIPSIFCPSSHLILDASHCHECGWSRPSVGGQGEILWEVNLEAGFGGAGRHVFYSPVVIQDTIILPLQNGQIAAHSLSDGRQLWQTELGPGLMTRHLISDGKRVIASLSDERQFTEAEQGCIVAIAPDSGAIEVLWQADTPLLSTPLLQNDSIFLRTSAPALVALKNATTLQPEWQVHLNSSGMMLSPSLGNQSVVVYDGDSVRSVGFLAFYSVDTGKFVGKVPIKGMLSQRAALEDDILFYLDNKRNKQLNALDISSRMPLWNQAFKRVYTPPVCYNNMVFIVVRGDEPSGKPGHYRLLALAAQDGQLKWEYPLEKRVFIPPYANNGNLYIASEYGLILCINSHSGTLIWSSDLDCEEDPLRTELVLTNGTLIVGTYHGKIRAIQAGSPQIELEDAKTYEDRDEFEKAAVIHALNGDYRKAARLYEKQIREPKRALSLYEKASAYDTAAKLAKSIGLLDEADHYYGLAKNFLKQGEIRMQRGNHLGAAELFKQAGKLEQAAQLFEEGGEVGKARELYSQVGDLDSYIRLISEGDASIDDIDLLEKEGRILEAADAAANYGLLERAIKLYQQAGAPEQELEAMWELAQKNPSHEWAWKQITEHARKLGKFVFEATAWEKLGRISVTADAYYRAAIQAEKRTPEDIEGIVRIFQKANQYFITADLQKKAKECSYKIAQYLRQPIITIYGESQTEFRENGWNTLYLRVCNDGFGRARNISWEIITDLFDVRYFKPESHKLDVLRQSREEKIEISMRPHQNEEGHAVPFTLELSWQDDKGKETFLKRISQAVPVKSKDDELPTGQPIIINEGGQLINAAEYVAGDNLASGAQKGDRVEVHRDGRTRVSVGEDRVEVGGESAPAEKTCPVCTSPVDPDAKFCSACQNPLKPRRKTTKKKKK